MVNLVVIRIDHTVRLVFDQCFTIVSRVCGMNLDVVVPFVCVAMLKVLGRPFPAVARRQKILIVQLHLRVSPLRRPVVNLHVLSCDAFHVVATDSALFRE